MPEASTRLPLEGMSWKLKLEILGDKKVCRKFSSFVKIGEIYVAIYINEWVHFIWYMIYLVTAIGLKPGGSSTVHTYTQPVHRTTQWNRIHRTQHT